MDAASRVANPGIETIVVLDDQLCALARGEQ